MTQNNFKKFALSCIALAAPLFFFGQQASTDVAAAAAPSAGIDINVVLLIVAVFLLLPIFITGNAFLLSLKEFTKKAGNNTTKIVGFVFFFFLASAAQAQGADATTAAAPAPAATTFFGWSPWILTSVIIFEALLIVFLSWLTMVLIKHATATEEVPGQAPVETTSWLGRFWDRINSFKPIEEEGDIDTGHHYDGIRELNNVTPPWFITAFVLTIIFGIIYMYRYHISKSAPLQDEEFAIEMTQAAEDKAAFAAKQTSSIDENNVVMMEGADIEAGKKNFLATCASCHGATGGSMKGGVGPNLTDEYWIHSGSLKDIFKSIKYGWSGTAMIAWKDQFSAKQIAQLSSYVKSINGSNPPNAKAPDGELYKEVVTAPADTNVTDTTKTKK